MIILAAVTISIVLNGGLIQQAQNATTGSSAAALDEKAKLKAAEIAIWKVENGNNTNNVSKRNVTLSDYVNSVTGTTDGKRRNRR